jgi:hypothetical protein
VVEATIYGLALDDQTLALVEGPGRTVDQPQAA